MEKKGPIEITEQELRKMQLLQLSILKEIDAICRKNKINYTVCGGTMLGAIRHEGFIPWDDDIDVTMLREDYDRFCEICKEELDHEKFFLQTTDTDPEYRMIYGRILLNGTSYVRYGQEHMKARTGVFVDIFPRDGSSDHFLISELQRHLGFLMRKMLYSPVGVRNTKSAYWKFIFGIFSKMDRKHALNVLRLIQWLNFGKKTEIVCCWGLMSNKERRKLEMGKRDFRAYMKKTKCHRSKQEQKEYKERERGIHRDWFYAVEDVPFEDMNVMITSRYDTWLTWNYDDYMKLPPVEKRKIHQTVSSFKL